MTMRLTHAQRLLLALLALYAGTACAQRSQPKPVEISLKRIGQPQFPTGFWASMADPHFRHATDMLFWLSPDAVATTFFKEYCCESSGKSGARYGAAVFDLTGKLVAKHEWTSMSDAPFHIGGAVGAFWVRYSGKIELLRADFTVGGQIPLQKGSTVVWSKSGHGMAVQDGTVLSIYDFPNGTAAIPVTIPAGTRAADVNGHVALLNSAPNANSCTVAVIETSVQLSWVPVSNAEKVGNWCPSGLGLLAADVVLVSEPRLSPGLEFATKIARRDGTIDEIDSKGRLLEIAESGRLAFQSFDPNPFAQALDMDFGGHKIFTVYDSARKAAIFKTKKGGQAGTSLSPDGHHLALVDGDKLLIYSLP
jgi:hypothetical protein